MDDAAKVHPRLIRSVLMMSIICASWAVILICVGLTNSNPPSEGVCEIAVIGDNVLAFANIALHGKG